MMTEFGMRSAIFTSPLDAKQRQVVPPCGPTLHSCTVALACTDRR